MQVVSTEPLQFGIGVSSRYFKKAVDRNRIKRQCREAFRLQKLAFKAGLEQEQIFVSVFFIYTGKELPAYDEVFEKTGLILQKLPNYLKKKS